MSIVTNRKNFQEEFAELLSLECTFQTLKMIITDPPALRYFDSTKKIIPQNDASKCGVGSFLFQGDSGVLNLFASASRQMN